MTDPKNNNRFVGRIEEFPDCGRSTPAWPPLRAVVARCAGFSALLLAVSLVPWLMMFAQQPNAPAFEVASIKPIKPETAASPVIGISADRITLTNFTLKQLIGYAYWIHANQILGASGWMDSDKFEVVAKPDKGFVPEELRRRMLQTLLADRFRLKFHHDAKQLQAFVLSVAQNGSRMKARTPGDGGAGFRLMFQGATLPGRNASVAQLAWVLQAVVLDRPVVDKTGLTGNFDFDLFWSPNETQFDGRGAHMTADPDSPDLFTALREQLGLRLVSQKLLVDVLVLDEAEKPGSD